MLMLAAALTLSSCKGDMGNIGLNSDNTDTSDTLSIADGTSSDTVAPDDEIKELKELNGKTPEQLYKATENLLSEMTKYDLSLSYSFGFASGTISSSVALSQDVRVTDVGAYSKSDMGDGVVSEYVYVDGIAYISNGTDKIKYDDLTLEDFIEQFGLTFDAEGDWVDGKYLDFSNAVFKPNGKLYALELSAPSEKAKQYVSDTLSSDDIKSASLSVKLSFDEQGTVKEYVMNADYTETSEGVSLKSTVRSELKFKSIGSAASVTAPSDAQAYVQAPDIGDMDGDGVVDEFDEFIAGEYVDVNNDGVIDMADALLIEETTEEAWKQRIVPTFAELWNAFGE